MRWKLFFWLNPNASSKKQTFGFKSENTAPANILLKPFEDDLLETISKIEYKKVTNPLQTIPVPTIASCSRVDSTPRTQEEEEEEEGYNSEDEYSHVGQTLSEAEWLEKDLSFDDTMEMDVQLSGEPDTDSSEPDNNRSDTPSPPPPEETEESDSEEAVRGYQYNAFSFE